MSNSESNDNNGSMDVEGDRCDNVTQPTEVGKTRVRGATMLGKIKKLTCDGKKIPIKCNKYGKGVNKKASLMQSYIGYLARTYVSISYPKWKAVPMETKNSIYETIEKTFDVPPVLTKKMILRSAGDKWKNFKTILGKYVVDEGVFRTEPPLMYPFIDQQSWESYVQQRCTKDFQERSRINTEHSKKNLYPHRLSRMGYGRKEYKMLKEQNKDPTVEDLPRGQLWKAARQAPNGGYHDDATANVAKKIDMYTLQQSQGILTPTGTGDILTLALEKDEYHGRVRAVGFGVSKKAYFGITKPRASASKEEVTALRVEVADLKQKLAEFSNLKEKLELLQRHWVNQAPQLQVPPPSKCNSPSEQQVLELLEEQSPPFEKQHPPLLDLPAQEQQEILKRCTLFWPDKTKEVAKGRVFIPHESYTSILHCKKIDSKKVLKVNIDTVFPECGKVTLPYPTDEIKCLSDAPGYIIGWPRVLVVIEPDSAHNSKGSRAIIVEPIQIQNNDHPHLQQQSFNKYLSLVLSGKQVLIEVDMPKSVLQHTHKLPIGTDEIAMWLDQGELEAIHISFYMKFLFDNYKPKMHSFLCPTRLAAIRDKNGKLVRSKDDKKDIRTLYMSSSMCQENAAGRLWLAPYNGGKHWTLVMINPQLNQIYWLDPLRGKIPPDFAKMCVRALTVYHIKVHKSKSPPISWINIKKFPLEPNSELCGFYICRFMRDIIKEDAISIPESYLPGSGDSYTEQQIDEVTNEWLGHLEPLLQLAGCFD